MISYLEGEVLRRGSGFVIVFVGGIGYRVILPDEFAQTLHGSVKLFTHELIRESEHELFGFRSFEQWELFLRMTQVSGVGPKSGQKIVFAEEADRIVRHITEGNLAFFTAVPGIGKKTAQKILLELKGVLVEEESVVQGEDEVIEALQALGYARKDVLEILPRLSGDSLEERVRSALKWLSK